MSTEFKDKVAFVTGAASGMGLSAAKAFAEAGAKVVLVDVTEPTAQAKQISENGHLAIAIRCDVTDEQQVRAAVQETVTKFGRLDFAFNNVGIQSPAVETADLDGKEYDLILAINLKGVWNCMKYQLQYMREQGSGSIVNNSSLGGLVGVPGRAAYHASKHGILGLTKSAALEYARRNMRINAICPGIVSTPMVEGMLANEPEAMDELIKVVPMGRLARAEEISSVVLFLSSSGASYITGQAITEVIQLNNDLACLGWCNKVPEGKGAITKENLVKKVKEAYPKDFEEVLKVYPHSNAKEVEWAATNLASDRFLGYSTWKWFDMHRKTSTQPVYRYFYSKLRPPLVDQNLTSGLAGGTQRRQEGAPQFVPIGAPHACEIEYCLGNLDLVKEYAWTADDYKVSEIMQNYFANFIKTGNPNGEKLPDWPAAQANDTTPPVMILDTESKAVKYDDTRYLFLDKVNKNNH